MRKTMLTPKRLEMKDMVYENPMYKTKLMERRNKILKKSGPAGYQ